jgi:hypothetical protein
MKLYEKKNGKQSMVELKRPQRLNAHAGIGTIFFVLASRRARNVKTLAGFGRGWLAVWAFFPGKQF